MLLSEVTSELRSSRKARQNSTCRLGGSLVTDGQSEGLLKFNSARSSMHHKPRLCLGLDTVAGGHGIGPTVRYVVSALLKRRMDRDTAIFQTARGRNSKP